MLQVLDCGDDGWMAAINLQLCTRFGANHAASTGEKQSRVGYLEILYIERKVKCTKQLLSTVHCQLCMICERSTVGTIVIDPCYAIATPAHVKQVKGCPKFHKEKS